MKVALDIVEDALRGYKNISPAEVTSIITTIKSEAQASQAPRTKRPRKPFVILVSDPDNRLQGLELTGWIFQVEPEDEMEPLAPRIARVAADFNASKKGRKNPVSTIGETVMFATPRQFKALNLNRKHKEPVFVQRTDNRLPGQDTETD